VDDRSVSDIIGEILQVVGVQKDVEKFVKYLGYPERPTALTDLVMVGKAWPFSCFCQPMS
jgi:hypothetical protein